MKAVSHFTLTDIKRLTKNVYEIRRKMLSKNPNNLEEIYKSWEIKNLIIK